MTQAECYQHNREAIHKLVHGLIELRTASGKTISEIAHACHSQAFGVLMTKFESRDYPHTTHCVSLYSGALIWAGIYSVITLSLDGIPASEPGKLDENKKPMVALMTHNAGNLLGIHIDTVRKRYTTPISGGELADRCQRSIDWVRAYEEMDAVPILDDVCLYASAIGAKIDTDLSVLESL